MHSHERQVHVERCADIVVADEARRLFGEQLCVVRSVEALRCRMQCSATVVAEVGRISADSAVWGPLRKTPVVLSFPNVCPEPVLVKWSFLE